MEYTYNLGEIREIIDTLLRRELGQSEESDLHVEAETDSDYIDNPAGADEENGQFEDRVELNSTKTCVDNTSMGVTEAAHNIGEMTSVTNERITTTDQSLVTEDMSLKVVLTYFFYVDDSSEAVEQNDEAAANIEDIVDNSEKDSDATNDVSDSDFDADIDSLDDSNCQPSYQLQSFSLMNIFDSVCEDNYDFTGSLDFSDGNLCRDRVGSDSDKDTLDWYTDSSEDTLSAIPDEEIRSNTARSDPCSTVKGGNSPGAALETKHYSGSTFSVSKCNSEIRHKLIKRLFRKVFPKNKYVVNKKK